MLRALASSSPLIRDAFIRTLSLDILEESPIATVYRKGQWIFVHLHTTVSQDVSHWIASTYLPERLYFPVVGYSIDLMHEMGDVIVPNVFLSYDPALEKIEITKANRDALIKNPRFLTTFDEQKDYYVEDYGLSVGGIVVDGVPRDPDDDLMGKMMLAYESDIYTEVSLSPLLDAVIDDQIPSLILTAIIRGKPHSRYGSSHVEDLIAKNIVTTIRLMEEE